MPINRRILGDNLEILKVGCIGSQKSARSAKLKATRKGGEALRGAACGEGEEQRLIAGFAGGLGASSA
ncbi:hypothetical protein FACS1894200_10440 [Spirochaetia bacterium]|nr:hypothetical protein FACS1894200_10440 [Spirochaetia bacterium]